MELHNLAANRTLIVRVVLSLVNPIDVPIGDDAIEIPIPLREHPTPPRLTSQASELSINRRIEPPRPNLINSHNWDYELVYEARMEHQDLLRLFVDLNVTPPVRLAAVALSGDLLTELLLFRSVFPAFSDYYSALRSPETGDPYRVRVLDELVDRIGNVVAATGPASPFAAQALRLSEQTLAFEIDDFTYSDGPPCEPNSSDLTDCRQIQMRWEVAEPSSDLPASIGPFPEQPAERSQEDELDVSITTDVNNDGILDASDVFGEEVYEVRTALPAAASVGDSLDVTDGRVTQTRLLTESDLAEGSVTLDFAIPNEGGSIHVQATLTRSGGALIGEGDDSALVLAGIYTVRFRESEATEEEDYRGRILRVHNLDVLKFESTQPRGHMLRNLRLRTPEGADPPDKYDVNPEFVYETAEVSLVDVHVPRLVVTELIPLRDPSLYSSLTGHLAYLFKTFFSGVVVGMTPTRRARLEIRYSFDAAGSVDLSTSQPTAIEAVPIASAQRLLPPRDISLDPSGRTELIALLVNDLRLWQADFTPSDDGRLEFDLLLYASIVPADQDRPLIHVKRIGLPLTQVSSWE